MTDESIDVEAEDQDQLVEATEVNDSADAADGSPVFRAHLILKRGGVETEHVFEFTAPATVGRFDPGIGPIDVDLGTIDEGVYVSRKHAKITCEDGEWKVTDLGSSNGTFVLKDDFERVEESPLEDNAELAFGNARFIFRKSKRAL